MHPLVIVSPEYALSPSLCLGAGPLGLRAADELRCAAGPVIAIGLRAHATGLVGDIDEHGQRTSVAIGLDADQLEPVEGPGARVEVELDDRRVALAASSVEVDGARLILLDADLDENHADDRALTRTLVPASPRQLALLRSGAARLLEAMAVTPREQVFVSSEEPRPRPAVDLARWVSADAVQTLALEPDRVRGAAFATRVAQTKTRALWNLRARARERMIDRLNARGLMAGDSDALWIGCGGRMGSASRPELLLSDLARLERLLDDPVMPVRLAIAGAADPSDPAAMAALARVAEVARDYRFDGRLWFLPGEDLELMGLLVEGVDLWLSTPTRGADSEPWGIAAAANGALNLAIRDGWWAEVAAAEDPEAEAEAEPSPALGWTIAGAGEFDDRSGQDQFDARMVFERLEREVVPCFYDWDNEGVPQAWVERIRASLSTIPARFDMRAR